jgi:pimeloyl-ACP methyl ester carboxylesterase
MPFPFRDEIKNLDNQARKAAGGSYIQLPDGITHFDLTNDPPAFTNESGMVRDVVLVHGFSVPSFIFDPTFEFLTRSGFRVLRYDLFGRGFSDRPRARYNIDFFVKQLQDVLDALGFISPVNLIGLSMGGPITATFTARHPERVKSMTLIDPSGARAVSLTPMLKVAKIPIVAEIVFGWMGSDGMSQTVVNDFFDPEYIEQFIGKYRVQMQFKGFKRALLSSVRNNTLGSFMNSYQRVGKMDKPVLLFWGRNDIAVPLSHSVDLRAVMPNAEFHVVENCGHIPHYEKPDVVNPILLNFLRTT